MDRRPTESIVAYEKRISIAFLVPGLLYPAWHTLAPADAFDPWWLWFVIGGCIASAGLLHLNGSISHEKMLRLIPWLAALVTVHFFALATVNDMLPFYAVGSTMAGMAPVLFLRTRGGLIGYASFICALSIALYAARPDERVIAYWGSLVPVFALGYYQVERQSRQKQQLEDAVADRTRALVRANQQLHHEIEERSRVEEELRTQNKMEAIGRLAGGIAHDFNNLLSTIAVYSELLEQGLAPNDPLQADVAHIQRASEQAASITQQLLAVGRRSHLHTGVIDLNELILGIDTMLRHLLGPNHQVVSRLGRGAHCILGNVDQVQQILINLAKNARDAMPNDGLLEIETCRVRSTDLADAQAAGSGCADHYVRLSVSDTGSGMSSKVVEHVFEPFFSTKTPDKGSGLGLALVHGILAEASGFVRVRSAEGCGSRFELYWPSAEGCPQAIERGTPQSLAAGGESILVVEDDNELRGGLCLVLRNAGYCVTEASSGEQALTVLEKSEERFDLVLSDVVMYRVAGIEVAERASRLHAQTKVLLMSGHLGEEGPVGLPGGWPLLAKPFSPSHLVSEVRLILDGGRARRN